MINSSNTSPRILPVNNKNDPPSNKEQNRDNNTSNYPPPPTTDYGENPLPETELYSRPVDAISGEPAPPSVRDNTHPENDSTDFSDGTVTGSDDDTDNIGNSGHSETGGAAKPGNLSTINRLAAGFTGVTGSTIIRTMQGTVDLGNPVTAATTLAQHAPVLLSAIAGDDSPTASVAKYIAMGITGGGIVMSLATAATAASYTAMAGILGVGALRLGCQLAAPRLLEPLSARFSDSSRGYVLPWLCTGTDMVMTALLPCHFRTPVGCDHFTWLGGKTTIGSQACPVPAISSDQLPVRSTMLSAPEDGIACPPTGNYSVPTDCPLKEPRVCPLNPFSDIKERVVAVFPELVLPQSGSAYSAELDGILISPGGRHVYQTWLQKNTFHLWSRDRCNTYPATLESSYQLNRPHSPAISPDGRHFYIFSGGTELIVYDRHQMTGVLSSPRTIISCDKELPFSRNKVTFSSDGRYVYVPFSDNLSLYHRDADTGELSGRRIHDSWDPSRIGASNIMFKPYFSLWSQNNRHFYITNNRGYGYEYKRPTLVLYDVKTDGTLANPYIYRHGGHGVDCVFEEQPDEISWGPPYSCKKEEKLQKKLVSAINSVSHSHDLHEVRGMIQSPDGRHLYTITNSGSLSIYGVDQDSGFLFVKDVTKHDIPPAYKLAMSPDNTLLAVLSKNDDSSYTTVLVHDIDSHDGSLSNARIYPFPGLGKAVAGLSHKEKTLTE